MTNYLTADTDLTAVANAIRTKGGTSAPLTFPAGFVSAVEAIETGGGGYTANDWLDPYKPTGEVSSDVAIANTNVFKSKYVNLLCNRKNITKVSLPYATFIPSGFCQGCESLERVYAPLVKRLDMNAFSGCSSLQYAVFPLLETGYSTEFNGCTRLLGADIFGVTLTTKMFYDCEKMATLVLRNPNAICTLSNINVFTNTPFATGKSGGTLYVPQDLISSYQNATNWSTILGYANNRILPIEGSIYETQYVDGTPIN